MNALSLQTWLASSEDDLEPDELRRIVRLQVAVALGANQSPLRLWNARISATPFGDAVALRDPTRPNDGLYNRVIGFRPSAIGYVDDWVRLYEHAGIPCQIDVARACLTDEVRACLAERGFGFTGAAHTSAADPRELARRAARRHPAIEIENVTPATLADALAIRATVKGLPPVSAELIRERQRELERDDRYLVCLARVDGEPAALGSLFFDGGAAYLANAATLPALRGRGCQTALLDHRAREAARRGCDLIVTDTLVGLQSERNVTRAGLERGFSVGWWCRARPAGVQAPA